VGRDFTAGRGERILVVEDEPAVRTLVVTLLMSGYATGSRRREDEAEGAVEILHKPFRRVDLARKIRSILESDR
jgi:CheY-like chemotaxis protein